jgi:hypothetical protein
MKTHLSFYSVCLLLLLSTVAVAQSQSIACFSVWNNLQWEQPRISDTTMEKMRAAIKREIVEAEPSSSAATSGPTALSYAVVQFNPVPDSGMTGRLVRCWLQYSTTRAQVGPVFREAKSQVDAAMAKRGRANNVAAALAYFLIMTSAAYHGDGIASPAVESALVDVIQREMSAIPEFKSMTDLQKQRLYDWFILQGLFSYQLYQSSVGKTAYKVYARARDTAEELFQTIFGSESVYDFGAVKLTSNTQPNRVPPNGVCLSGIWKSPISAATGANLERAIVGRMFYAAAANGPPPPTSQAPPNYAVLQFKPVPDSGVANKLLECWLANPQDRELVLPRMQAMKSVVDEGLAKVGRQNNVAAALAFSLVLTSAIYHQNRIAIPAVELPLFETIQKELSAAPEIKSMTDFEKQSFYDWLILESVYTYHLWEVAKEKGNETQIFPLKEKAAFFYKAVLNTDIRSFNFGLLDRL